MSNKDNKNIDEQEKLLDHLIEYGGRQYIHDEVKKYEDIPELEPSKEFDERMNRMFQEAYKNEVHHERVRFGKKIAVIAVVVIGVVSAAAMNIKAVREPVLNFVFHKSDNQNKSKVNFNSKDNLDFVFKYMPTDYSFSKKIHTDGKSQIYYEYKNNNEEYIYINVQLNQKYNNYINQNSSKKYEEISSKNRTYYFLNGSKNNTLMFFKNNCIFTITSKISSSELIKIAEKTSIKK